MANTLGPHLSYYWTLWQVDHNSVKVYNEQNVLRIETTINAPDMFRVYRRAQGRPPTARKKLRPLRKGVADIPYTRRHILGCRTNRQTALGAYQPTPSPPARSWPHPQNPEPSPLPPHRQGASTYHGAQRHALGLNRTASGHGCLSCPFRPSLPLAPLAKAPCMVRANRVATPR